MLNFLAAEATEKYSWSNDFYYMFKEDKVVPWGGWVLVIGQLTTLSFLQVKLCLNIPWSTQLLAL